MFFVYESCENKYYLIYNLNDINLLRFIKYNMYEYNKITNYRYSET